MFVGKPGAPLAQIDAAQDSSPSEDETSKQSVDGVKVAAVKGVLKQPSLGNMAAAMATPWDPVHCPDWDRQPVSSMCLRRIQADITNLYKDPPAGIFLVPDETDVTQLHALIVGPFDTPYEGGFFYFRLRCPPDYPIKAPRVRLMTTGDDSVRFNPNLYRNGKVCLSFLGTWSGPAWSPALTLSGVLMSIQTLMNEKPYHNEPGFENEHAVGDSDRYNAIVAHETVRVAVCQMLEGTSAAGRNCPETLKEMMRNYFHTAYDHYVETCRRLAERGLQGAQMMDPFGEKRGKFDPVGLKTRLESLKARFPSNDDTAAPNEMDCTEKT